MSLIKKKWHKDNYIEPSERFKKFCNPPDLNGCIRWNGGKNNKGYGFFPFGGRNKHILAHRFVYQQKNGDIPVGFQVDHLCKIRDCVNTDHLRAIDGSENMGQHNRSKTHCKYGHEFNEMNTWREGNKYRHCRICDRLRKRQRRVKLNPDKIPQKWRFKTGNEFNGKRTKNMA